MVETLRWHRIIHSLLSLELSRTYTLRAASVSCSASLYICTEIIVVYVRLLTTLTYILGYAHEQKAQGVRLIGIANKNAGHVTSMH